jgi:NAD(P)-dependent dehydrogenase (short-subunit alcohol dehydrogenase family)
MEPLHNKVAIVTGGSRGIGAATAVLLAKAGANVVINYYSSEKDALNVLTEVESLGRKGKIVQADVRNPEDVKRLVDETVNEFGKVDILVNNANIQFAFKPFVEMSWDEFSIKTRPGETTLVLIFFGPNSFAKYLAKVLIAAFALPWAIKPGDFLWPKFNPLLMFTAKQITSTFFCLYCI